MKTEEEVRLRLRKCRSGLYDSNLSEEAIKRLGLIELILEWVLGDSKEI